MQVVVTGYEYGIILFNPVLSTIILFMVVGGKLLCVRVCFEFEKYEVCAGTGAHAVVC